MYVPIQLDHKCDQLNKLIDFFPFCHNNESKQKCIDLMKMNVHLITKRHSNVTPPLQLLPPRLLLLRLNAVCNIPLSSVIQHEDSTPISNDSTEYELEDSQLQSEENTERNDNTQNLGSVLYDDSKENYVGLQDSVVDDENSEENDYKGSESDDDNTGLQDSEVDDENSEDDDNGSESDHDEYLNSEILTGNEKENNTFWNDDLQSEPFKENTHTHSSNKKKKSQKRSKSAHFFGDL